MKLNCKPGDLAVCIRDCKTQVPISPLGKTCTVLYMAPGGRFELPDGYMQAISTAGKEWVVEWSGEMAYPLKPTGWRKTRFGIVPDSALRPIRDNDQPDETLQWLEAPRKVAA